MTDYKKEQEDFITQQREAQEKEALNTPGARERYMICQQCDRFWPTVKGCSECYCFMPLKTQIKSMSCPLGKW